jgi:hypothetical protein
MRGAAGPASGIVVSMREYAGRMMRPVTGPVGVR